VRGLLVLVAALSALLTGSALADVSAGPPRLQLKERCVTKVERRRAVRFLAADRTRLIGLELGSGRRGLVLAHGRNQSLCEWIRHGRRYARAGYRVLLFDHRNHGSSTYTKKRYWRMDYDVVGAVRTLRNRGAKTVVLAGSSMGATAVLVGAVASQPAVDGVVSLSAPTNVSTVNAEAAVQLLAVPTLFVAAERDDPFNVDAQTLFDASVAREKHLELLPGSAAHGSGLLAFASVRTLFDEFLRVHSD
jgi:alpha-beta hydrolase superfamily lysophospholipase